jgi:hypothetical protein
MGIQLVGVVLRLAEEAPSGGSVEHVKGGNPMIKDEVVAPRLLTTLGTRSYSHLLRASRGRSYSQVLRMNERDFQK